jgi:predicted hydrolase (HD superfamily)
MENISQDEAVRLIRSTSKYDHALLVSIIMAEMAREMGDYVHLWKIVGYSA